MKSLTTTLSLAAGLMLAACASSPPISPNDTGNMAYPTPVPQGNIGVARPAIRDTGNMSLPAASGGTLQPSPTNDTGNMALPGRAQGNSIPGRY